MMCVTAAADIHYLTNEMVLPARNRPLHQTLINPVRAHRNGVIVGFEILLTRLSYSDAAKFTLLSRIGKSLFCLNQLTLREVDSCIHCVQFSNSLTCDLYRRPQKKAGHDACYDQVRPSAGRRPDTTRR